MRRLFHLCVFTAGHSVTAGANLCIGILNLMRRMTVTAVGVVDEWSVVEMDDITLVQAD